MEHQALIIASFFAGLWNVLHEKFVSIQNSICLFMLGSGFCYVAASVAGHYGFGTELSTSIGYVCGVLSPSIYKALVKCLEKLPEIFAGKFGEK